MGIRLLFGVATVLAIALALTLTLDDPRYRSARLLTSSMITVADSLYAPVDARELFASAWLGMKGILDPYTNFIPEESYRYVEEESRGSFEGIGVEITVRDGLVTVISPIAGSNAEEVGLRSGDQVISVDSVDVDGMAADEVTSLIRGPAGTTVLLGIKRPGISEPFEVTVERRKVELNSVDFSGIVDSIGYIRLTRFALTTPYEVSESIETLLRQGIRGIVLDLRGNPGGFMSSAVYIAELFLPSDKLILATKSRRGWENYSIRTQQDGPLMDMPLAILIDRGSASASEIVAGTLQDYDRAVVIGDTTFGKGLVQTNLMLEGGNAFRVTTSKYYLPSGRLVQRFSDRDWAKYLNVSRSELNTAFRTEGGRSVYGGGGVAPDFAIPPDSVNLLGTALSYGNYFFRFVVDYRVEHSDSIPLRVDESVVFDFRDYVGDLGFTVPNILLAAVTELEDAIADTDGRIPAQVFERMKNKARRFEQQLWMESHDYIVERLREGFANQRGGRSEIYTGSRLRYDQTIQKAFHILSDDSLYLQTLNSE